jgi:uncharacterized protein
MKCPACFNQLKEVQAGNTKVDVCEGGCGGIWFDAFELQRVDEEHDIEGDQLFHLERDEHTHVDPKRKRNCPRCDDIKLKRHFFSAKRRVEVDQCPNCGGYWIDYGELALIRDERNQAVKAEQERQAGVSIEVIRYIYRLRVEVGDGPPPN